MQYLNFQTVQQMLDGRSRSSLYRDIEAGRLPKPVKIGARLYWSKEDIRSAIEKLAV